MLRDILRDSSTVETWREEGREQGLEQGREEGREQGQRELVRLALEGRFGELAADEQAALSTADTAALRAIAVHLTTESRDQIRNRLGLS